MGGKNTRSTLVFSQQPKSNFWKPNQNCLAIFFGNQSSVVFDITTSWLFTNFSEASWKDELATLERFFETRVSSRHRGLLEVHRCTSISYIPNAWHLSFPRMKYGLLTLLGHINLFFLYKSKHFLNLTSLGWASAMVHVQVCCHWKPKGLVS